MSIVTSSHPSIAGTTDSTLVNVVTMMLEDRNKDLLEPVMGSSSSSPAKERERATIGSARQAGAKVYDLNFVLQNVFIIAVLFIDKHTIKRTFERQSIS